MELQEKQKLRYQVLSSLYELTGGNRLQRIQSEKLQEQTALETGLFRNTLQYLIDEGLAKRSNLVVEITHPGIVEFEATRVNPTESTSHFPTQVIQHFHAPVGVVQTGHQGKWWSRREIPCSISCRTQSTDMFATL